MIKVNKSQWKKYKFGKIVSNISERAEPKETNLDIYVGLEHLDPDCIHIKRKGHPSDVKGTKLRVYPGDIIFGKRRAYQRKAAVVDFDGICSAHAMVVRANPKVILPKLLPYFMHSDAFMHRAVDVSEGSLSPTIKWKILAEQQFKLPPTEEQKSIADLLWSADETIGKYTETSLCLDRIMQSLEWNFFKKRKPWKTLKIEDIAQVDYGISESVADNKDSAIGWPILTGANITLDGELDLFKLVYIERPKKEQFFLRKGDLLLNWRSGSPAHVGKTALFELDGNYTYASFVLRIRVNRKLFMPEYGFYLFNFLRRTEYFTKDVAQQVNFKMNANVFRSVEIPVPVLEEQERIVGELNTIARRKKIVDLFINNTNKIKKQIINQIFG